MKLKPNIFLGSMFIINSRATDEFQNPFRNLLDPPTEMNFNYNSNDNFVNLELGGYIKPQGTASISVSKELHGHGKALKPNKEFRIYFPEHDFGPLDTDQMDVTSDLSLGNKEIYSSKKVQLGKRPRIQIPNVGKQQIVDKHLGTKQDDDSRLFGYLSNVCTQSGMETVHLGKLSASLNLLKTENPLVSDSISPTKDLISMLDKDQKNPEVNHQNFFSKLHPENPVGKFLSLRNNQPFYNEISISHVSPEVEGMHGNSNSARDNFDCRIAEGITGILFKTSLDSDLNPPEKIAGIPLLNRGEMGKSSMYLKYPSMENTSTNMERLQIDPGTLKLDGLEFGKTSHIEFLKKILQAIPKPAKNGYFVQEHHLTIAVELLRKCIGGLLSKEFGCTLKKFTNDIDKWSIYWKIKANINIDLKDPNSDCTFIGLPYIIPVSLIYVHMFLTIIPIRRSGETEEVLEYAKEMQKAFKCFQKFKNFVENPSSDHKEIWTEKSTWISNRTTSKSNGSATMIWHFIEIWMQEEYPNLFQKLNKSKQKCNRLPTNVKQIFNNIFYYGFKTLTAKIQDMK